MTTSDEWRTAIGARVEVARAGRSVRSMAKRAGISEGLWRQIESGQRPIRKGEYETVKPKPSTVNAVCAVLGWPSNAFDRLLAGESLEDLYPKPGVSVSELEAVELINNQLGEWFMDYGPAGIPDEFLYDDDWMTDVRGRSLELFGVMMLERDRRRMATRLDEAASRSASASTGLNDVQKALTDKVLSVVEDLTARLIATEAEVQRLRKRRGSDGSS